MAKKTCRLSNQCLNSGTQVLLLALLLLAVADAEVRRKRWSASCGVCSSRGGGGEQDINQLLDILIYIGQSGGGGGSEPGKCSSNRDCPRCYPLIKGFGQDTDLLLYSTGTTQFAQSMATVSVQVIGEFTELEEKPMC